MTDVVNMEVSGRGRKTHSGGSEDVFEICTPCSDKGKQIEARGYCRNCKEYLCNHCFDCHTVPTAMAHHVLLDKSTMPRGQPRTLSLDVVTCTDTCPKHDKFIKFYCKKHRQAACTICLTLDHPDCKGHIAYIPEVAQNFENGEDYKSVVQQINAVKTSAEKFKKQMEDDLKMVEKEAKGAVAEIVQMKADLKVFIDKEFSCLQEKVEAAKVKNIGPLELKLASCNSILSAVDQLDATIKEQRNRRSALYVSISAGKAQLDNMSEEIKKLQDCHSARRFKFVPNETVVSLLQDPNAEMGSLKSVLQCTTCKQYLDDHKVLPCSHVICWTCLSQHQGTRVVCPACGTVSGNQPDGEMEVNERPDGEQFDVSGTNIVIRYKFSDGIQARDHPSPGTTYKGKDVTTFLWDNEEGRELLKMLKIAFERKLLFTISSSKVIPQKDIQQRTDPVGPLVRHSKSYRRCLSTLKQTLAAMGVSE